MTDAIIEAAARALKIRMTYADDARVLAIAVLTAVTPLIEAAALERAAKVAEDRAEKLDSNEAWGAAVDIATAIRALKKQP